MSDLVVGIIGYGAIADYHADAFRALDVPIRAVAGPNAVEATKFARRHDIPQALSNIDELLSDDSLSAVVIASPSQVHAAQARRSLESGRSVLCEIPLATSYGDTVALGHLAESRNLRLMVAHTQRYQRPLQLARAAVEQEEVKPRQVVVRYMMFRHENRGWTGRQRTWTDDLLWHHGAHAVDTCLWLLNSSAASVSAFATDEVNDIDAPMDVSITIRTTNGGIGTVTLSFNSRIALNDYLVIAGSTTLIATERDLLSPQGQIYAEESVDAVLRAAVRDQAVDFVDSIRHGRNPKAGVPEIAECMRILEEVEQQLGTASGRISARMS